MRNEPTLMQSAKSLWVLVTTLWLIVCLVISTVWYHVGMLRLTRNFQHDAQDTYLQIIQQFELNETALNSLRDLTESMIPLSGATFSRYAQWILRDYPSITLIALQRRVDSFSRTRFEQQLSKHYGRSIHIYDTHFNEPSSVQPYYIVTTHVGSRNGTSDALIGRNELTQSLTRSTVLAALQNEQTLVIAPKETVYTGTPGYVLIRAIFIANGPVYTQAKPNSLLQLHINTSQLLSKQTMMQNNLAVTLRNSDLPAQEPNAILFQHGQTHLKDHNSALTHFLPKLSTSRHLHNNYLPFELNVDRQLTLQDFAPLNLLFALGVSTLCALLLLMLLLQRFYAHQRSQQAATALFRSREHASVTLHAISDGVITFDREKHLEYLNPMAVSLTGMSLAKALNSTVDHVIQLRYELAHTLPDNPFDACLNSGQVIELAENSLLCKSPGVPLPIEGCVSPLFDQQRRIMGAVLTFRALGRAHQNALDALKTSEKRLRDHRAQLAHVARLHTMGEMASGIAHEINQPLAAIASYNQAAIHLLDDDEIDCTMIRHALNASVRQAQRAGDILLRLRAFVSRRPVELSPVSLNQVVHNVIALAEHELRDHHTQVQTSLDPALPPIEADYIQLEQVVLNLLRNALDATRYRSPTSIVQIHTWQEAKSVLLSVTDNGLGIAETLHDQLFTPFFTTKTDGMGLGLTICQSIIESFGGTIHAENRIGSNGAVFRLKLPTLPQPDKIELCQRP